MAETAPADGPSIVAVIPHYRAPARDLVPLIRAAAGQQHVRPDRVVVVANSPRHPSLERIPDLPGVTVLRPGLNLGYVGALEWARRVHAADFLWILQEDGLPAPDCLAQLLAAFEPDLAVASPVEINGAGKRTSNSRAGKFDLESASWVPLAAQDHEALFASTPLGARADGSAVFLYLSGALIRGSALQAIGGFDVNYWPLWLVDADTCMALQRAGYTIRLVPGAHFIHNRVPTDQDPAMHRLKQFAGRRNHRRYFGKYADHAVPPEQPTDAVPADLLRDVAAAMSEVLSFYYEVDARVPSAPSDPTAAPAAPAPAPSAPDQRTPEPRP